MIRVNSTFPPSWKHSKKHGSTLRAETYKNNEDEQIILVIYDYDNRALGKVMLNTDKVIELRDYLDGFIKKHPVQCRTGLFD